MMYGGLWLGRKVASRFRCDLSWISGVLLMAGFDEGPSLTRRDG